MALLAEFEWNLVNISLLLVAVAAFVTPLYKMRLDGKEKAAKAEADRQQKERDDAEKVRLAIESAAEKKEQRERDDEDRRAVAEVARKAEELKRQQEAGLKRAAEQVDGVKKTLEESTIIQAERMDEIQKTGEAVHTLVNSAMSQQLKIAAVALRRVADLTKHPDDVKAADIAAGGYREHEAKQRVVDGGGKMTQKDAPKSPGGSS